MKHIDYLYFNIYNYFHRSSLYRQSYNARIQTVYLFSIGSGGWLLLLQAVYIRLIKHSRFESPVQSTFFAASIYLLLALLFNYIFIVKERDQKLLSRYEELSNQNPKRKRHFIVSLCVLVFPYLVPLSIAVFGRGQ
ncbi:MAG: hypothetical protein P4L51_19985 [Puia sp.]|nr:hypothetical protein [Puia sp.]